MNLQTARCRFRAAFVSFYTYFLLFTYLCLLFTMDNVPTKRVLANDVEGSKQINCNIHGGACAQNLQSLTVTLDIHPKPVLAMQDLLFRVNLTGEIPDQAPHIDLGMPGMKMGPNRVTLKAVSRSSYKGNGIIVRCPSGRKIWQATITVPGKGKADFIFDVIY